MIISAKPKHAELASALIYQSGPVSFEHIFNMSHGPDIKTFLCEAFRSQKTIFSHLQHYIYEKNEDAVATIGLIKKQQHDKAFIDNAVWIWKAYGIRSILKGLAFELRLVKAPKKDCLYLCHIAVNPKHRGAGIATKLIAFAEEKAIDMNIKVLSLDVAENNANALNLYLSLGFKAIKINKSYNDVLDNHIYMEKTLKH